MGDISSYLTDHGNAGNCAWHYYNGTHNASTCLVSPGVCSVIAYLVAELKSAESQSRASSSYPLPAETRNTPAGGIGNNQTTYHLPVAPANSGGSYSGYSGSYSEDRYGSAPGETYPGSGPYPTNGGNGQGGTGGI